MVSQIKVDSVLESTSAAGVTIDGVLIKDGLVDGKDVSAITGGMTKIADSDFSDASDATFDNIFTSTYSNYAFKIYHQCADNNTEFRFRFRTGGASGSDETTAQ